VKTARLCHFCLWGAKEEKVERISQERIVETKKKQARGFKKGPRTGHQWLMPTILAAQEAEMRRIAVQSHPSK
jgi:hypothetical protein